MPEKRHLPVLTKVDLHNFTIYQNHRRISVPVRSGVFCLAGANGMGKSSFLASVNYGLTGITPDPRRTFNGPEKFYSDGIAFARKYFDGRVGQDDRTEALVSLDFRVGDHLYSIGRNFFETEELRYLTITDLNGYVLLETTDWSGKDRHSAYAARIVEDCHVADFYYFVFMQHFLLSFDERRNLLFWDTRAANLALYMAFGVDPQDTQRSEDLRLAIDGAESNARNAQWQATVARNNLVRLTGADASGLEQLRQTHDELVERLTEAREEVALAERAADDAGLEAAGASAQQQALRREYDTVFARKLAGNRDPARHPIVIQSLADHICDVCGSSSDESISEIEAALASNHCPLCDATVELSEALDFEELQRLDDELASAKIQVDATQARADRLRREAANAVVQATTAADSLEHFESANAERMTGILSASGEVEQERRSLEGEIRNATRRRDEYRRQRDELRQQREPLQNRLTTAYQAGELEFVPLFRRLAKRFIGIDLDVSLYKQQSMFGLSFEMLGVRRQAATELSESQRFFIEIALKMALAQYMSSTESPGGLLIDTPEGSLDIAYEARAGDMFADFAKDGYNLLMTANINSSQLLLRLAERCGSDYMELVRMTQWTSLTEVQAAEEHLFDEAFAKIEQKLVAGGSSHPE